jgi:hypothetical protein
MADNLLGWERPMDNATVNAYHRGAEAFADEWENAQPRRPIYTPLSFGSSTVVRLQISVVAAVVTQRGSAHAAIQPWVLMRQKDCWR